jgi:DNA-binding transcriptional regulator YhcF (GntR family)
VAVWRSRSQQVYATLRARILGGQIPPGAKLSNQRALAAEWQVSVSTMRQVLARLEAESLISSEPGRGTFVRGPATPAVLIVTAVAAVEALLVEHIAGKGYRVVAATSPREGLAALEQDASIALVLIDVRSPTPADGVRFIRLVRNRWPTVLLAALASDLAQLAPLRGTQEWPLLIVSMPIHTAQIDELLRLTLPPR